MTARVERKATVQRPRSAPPEHVATPAELGYVGPIPALEFDLPTAVPAPRTTAPPVQHRRDIGALIPLGLPDSGRQSVVGESHYQEALRAVAGGQTVAPLNGQNWDATIRVTAKLVPEPENPYDANAVRIDVDDRCVGYLPREVAELYQPALLALRATGRVGTCEGHITGGGKRNYGIFLHVADPSAIELAAALDGENAVLLIGDRPVTVTGEDKHQDVLGRLDLAVGHPSTARVSLDFCVITRGKYVGQRAIEVRIDDHRVGELTRAMSQRYEHRVEDALTKGKKAVCRAIVYQTRDRGIQLELLIG